MQKKTKWILLIIPLLTTMVSLAQVQLTPVLVGSAGGTGTAGSMSISWSAGEAVIQTVSNSSVILTQGFHQPRANESMMVVLTKTDATCNTSNDGTASVTVINGIGPFTYTWLNDVSDSAGAVDLSPGMYHVQVTDFYGRTDTANFEIGVMNDADCNIHIYSGFTPNSDGVNDLWVIDGITWFPDNHVSIFSRWGDKVWEAGAYDNNTVVFSGTGLNGQLLTEGTYYYIVNIADQQFTGWVELTR